MVTSEPELWLRATSGPMVLPQSESSVMSMATATVKGGMDALGQGYHLGPCRYLTVMLFQDHADVGDRWCQLGNIRVILFVSSKSVRF